MNEKNLKIKKRRHAFRDYASSHNAGILNYFNPDLQLKDTESAIKNKLKGLLTELKGFKFVTTLVLVFKKIESDEKTKHDTFIQSQKQKQLPMKVILMMYLNQSILQLYQTYKNL